MNFVFRYLFLAILLVSVDGRGNQSIWGKSPTYVTAETIITVHYFIQWELHLSVKISLTIMLKCQNIRICVRPCFHFRYQPINAFEILEKVTLGSIIHLDNILRIQNYFTKYLKESFW